jgi:hypothetical protein
MSSSDCPGMLGCVLCGWQLRSPATWSGFRPTRDRNLTTHSRSAGGGGPPNATAHATPPERCMLDSHWAVQITCLAMAQSRGVSDVPGAGQYWLPGRRLLVVRIPDAGRGWESRLWSLPGPGRPQWRPRGSEDRGWRGHPAGEPLSGRQAPATLNRRRRQHAPPRWLFVGLNRELVVKCAGLDGGTGV